MRRKYTAAKCLAAAALLGIGWMLFRDGPGAGRERRVGTTVFLGDSITEFCDLAAYYPGLDAVNEGISGDTTGGMLERLERVYADAPKAVVILGGINDILSGGEDGQVVENLSAIVRNIHERLPGAKIAVQSVYPIAEGEDLYFTGRIQAVNARLEALAEELDFRYIDVFSVTRTEDGRLNGAYSDDGLHPNSAGYQAACPVVREAIAEMTG